MSVAPGKRLAAIPAMAHDTRERGTNFIAPTQDLELGGYTDV